MSGRDGSSRDDAIETAIAEAARRISAARYCTALTGAGLSEESGVPTFRGAGGLWTRNGEPPLNGYQRFLAGPAAWWRKRLTEQEHPGELAAAIATAQPNAGHFALAELERLGYLQALITQNIDNLHNLAGSRNVLEIHGNRTLLRCIRCQQRFQPETVDISSLPPRCPSCDGTIKSDTVMFGEPIPETVLDACYTAARQSDCMLIAGTSAVVYPAADLPVVAWRHGATLIEVNPDETPLTPLCSLSLRGAAGVFLPRIVAAVHRTAIRRGGGC